MESWETMEEREFFNETTEATHSYADLSKCGQEGEYKVTWIVRRKRAQLPRGRRARPGQIRQGAILHGKTRRKAGLRQYPLPQGFRDQFAAIGGVYH